MKNVIRVVLDACVNIQTNNIGISLTEDLVLNGLKRFSICNLLAPVFSGVRDVQSPNHGPPLSKQLHAGGLVSSPLSRIM